ncbi:MAG: DUF748 domain-containing protein [Planctomycetaceae bacterium]
MQELRTEKTLFDLVFQSSNMGTIELVSPVLKVRLREGGSNLEDLINPILAAQEPSAEASDMRLVLQNGIVEIYDPSERLVNKTMLEELTLQTSSEKTNLELKGTVNEAPLEVTGEFDPAYNSGSVHWQTEHLNLASYQPLLSRWQPASRIAGWLTVDQTCAWDNSTPAHSRSEWSTGGRGAGVAIARSDGRGSLTT